MDGGDDGGRGVESIERRSLGAVILLRVEERLQLFAEGLPAGVLVTPSNRIRKNRQGHWPEAGEAAKHVLLLRRGGALFVLDGLQRADGGNDVAGFCLLTAGD